MKERISMTPVDGMPGMYTLDIKIEPVQLSPSYVAFCEKMNARRDPLTYLGYNIGLEIKDVKAMIKDTRKRLRMGMIRIFSDFGFFLRVF